MAKAIHLFGVALGCYVSLATTRVVNGSIRLDLTLEIIHRSKRRRLNPQPSSGSQKSLLANDWRSEYLLVGALLGPTVYRRPVWAGGGRAVGFAFLSVR